MSEEPDLIAALDRTYELIAASRARYEPRLSVREAGAIEWVGEAVAGVRGLPEVEAEELVRFPNGLLGLAFNLDAEEVGVVLLDDATGLEAGDPVERTGRELDVPVGDALLGRVVDAVGRPLDDAGPLLGAERRPVHRPAPPILDRAPVSVPLQTGIKVVDALVPVGRGQRELIIGDRETGKTAIAVTAMLNQKGGDVVCVYCAIGRRGSAVARVISELREHGTLDQSIVVIAGGEDAPGLQYIAPYAATSMAEWFMERGGDVLIVYDDLTRHARAYRELSLLLRRPPGREAYPGDIFHVHARLLERATQLSEQAGGGSLTALPVVETQAQNLAAYIPTNLISITDGQIYLAPTLFQKGVLPAVDVGRSVSRVGGAAQLPAYRAVTGRLRLSYSQFHELEQFSRFAAHLDEQTRQTLVHGRRIRDVLKQPESVVIPVEEQVAILLAATTGAFDDVPLRAMADAEAAVRAAVRAQLPATCARIHAGEALGDGDTDAMKDAARIAARPLAEVEQTTGEDVTGPLPAPATGD